MEYYNIYVFSCIPLFTKYFLYAAPPTSNPELEVAKLYPDFTIIDQTHVIENVTKEAIDGHVLKWMHIYGIDNVRGGSFTNLVLSDAEKQWIGDRIKYFYFELPENKEILKLNNVPPIPDHLKSLLQRFWPKLSLTDIKLLEFGLPSMEVCSHISDLYDQYCDYCHYFNLENKVNADFSIDSINSSIELMFYTLYNRVDEWLFDAGISRRIYTSFMNH